MSANQNPKNADTIPQPSEANCHYLPTPPQLAFKNYKRLIAHAVEIKFINNRCTTPITVEFGSSDSENTVTLLVKHRTIFIAIKLFDPSASITIKDKVITNHVEFPIVIEYTETFDVITNQKTKFPRFFCSSRSSLNIKCIHNEIGDHNIISTLQSLRTWANFNKFSTHCVASIAFLKYISTGLTLHSIEKQRVINALMNVDLNEKDNFFYFNSLLYISHVLGIQELNEICIYL